VPKSGNGSIDYLKSLEKGINKSHKKQTHFAACVLTSKIITNLQKRTHIIEKTNFAFGHNSHGQKRISTVVQSCYFIVLFSLLRNIYRYCVENYECLNLTITVTKELWQLLTSYISTLTEFVFKSLLYKPVS
jgi:hypothetical protein